MNYAKSSFDEQGKAGLEPANPIPTTKDKAFMNFKATEPLSLVPV